MTVEINQNFIVLRRIVQQINISSKNPQCLQCHESKTTFIIERQIEIYPVDVSNLNTIDFLLSKKSINLHSIPLYIIISFNNIKQSIRKNRILYSKRSNIFNIYFIPDDVCHISIFKKCNTIVLLILYYNYLFALSLSISISRSLSIYISISLYICIYISYLQTHTNERMHKKGKGSPSTKLCHGMLSYVMIRHLTRKMQDQAFYDI